MGMDRLRQESDQLANFAVKLFCGLMEMENRKNEPKNL
jgi:hypothetical protein